MSKLTETKDVLKIAWKEHRTAMIVAIAVGVVLGGLVVAVT